MKQSYEAKGSTSVQIITLEEKNFQLAQQNERLSEEKTELNLKVNQLMAEVEGASAAATNAEADQKLRDELIKFKKIKQSLEDQLLKE
jgi:hypothetical protein